MLHLRRVAQKVCYMRFLYGTELTQNLYYQNAVSRVGCTAASRCSSKRLQGLQGGRRGLATATEAPYDVVVIGGGMLLHLPLIR